jgi:hypothetical protein
MTTLRSEVSLQDTTMPFQEATLSVIGLLQQVGYMISKSSFWQDQV